MSSWRCMTRTIPGSVASETSSRRACHGCGVSSPGRVPNCCHVHVSKRQNLCALACRACRPHTEPSDGSASSFCFASTATSSSKPRTVASCPMKHARATCVAVDASTMSVALPPFTTEASGVLLLTSGLPLLMSFTS